MKFGIYSYKYLFNNNKLVEGLKELHDKKIYHRDVKVK